LDYYGGIKIPTDDAPKSDHSDHHSMSHKNSLRAWRRIRSDRRLRKSAQIRPGRRPMMLEQLEARWCLSANVLSYHNDIASTGVNNNETLLTPANVNVNSFGKLATVALDGQVYAQPLVDTGVTVAVGVNTANGAAGMHDVVFVATEHDSLYAIDAKQGDGGAILWKRTFLDISTPGYSGSTPGTNINSTPVNGVSASSISTVTRGDVTVNIGSEVGITGTPVIDPNTSTIFLDVKTTEIIGGATYVVQRLHTINVADGTDRVVPYLIGATTNDNTNTTNIYVYGTGDGAVTDPYNNTGKQVVQFNALREANRPALSFVNNQVYVAWASHGDNGPYHGWVATWTMGATQLTLTGVLCSSPNDGLSGIWQGGGKLAFEPDGSAFYFETGNGDGGAPVLNAQGFPTNANYNEALVKAVADPTTSPTNQNPNGWGLKVADYFIPYNVAALDGADSDFGSGAPIVLPDSAGIPGHPHLILAAGKSGQIYVIDRDNMGHFSPIGDNVLNAVPNGSGQNTPPVQLGGSLSTPAYYNGKVYWNSAYSGLSHSYMINSNGTLTATSQTAVNLGYSPGSVSISSNGTANGIAWVYDRNGNLLRAYDASSFSTELWDSGQHAGGTDSLGAAVEFAVPTIANGEVFAGTSSSLVIYGQNQAANSVPNAPVLSATAISGSSIKLTWTDSTTMPNTATAYLIEESTDGTSYSVAATAPAAATSIVIGGLQTQTTYYFRIRGLNAQGYSNYSIPAQATTSNTLNGLNYVNNAAGLPNVVVSLAYYDNEYGGGFIPSPWQGSPNVTFFGGQTTGVYDGGAVMFTNTGTTNAVLSPGVVVDNFANGASFQLWDSLIGTQTVIAPGQSLILTQTATGNFDTSDTPVGTTFANRSLILPHVHFTLNGTPYVLVDTTQVLNDAGWDEGNIQNISESTVWTQNQVIAGGFTGAAGLTLNGTAAVTGGNLVLTNGGANEASSVFTSNPVDVTSFTSQFTFQTSGKYAYANTGEGLTFTIQGAGPTALGGSGAALGYGAVGGGSAGINQSVAIKFDLNNNSGEGNDSTGLYTNAASPTTAGSIDLTSMGIDLHSGDIFRVNLTYVGTTLTVVINDLTTNTSSMQNYTINIPGVIGSSIGYVGFTGSTGSQEALQNIISWAYAPTAATSPNAPSGLGATPASATSINLNWTNNAANQTSFNLDRATSSDFTQNLITENLPASPNTFTDTYTGLAPGNTYYYRLRAFNAAGNSGYSNMASVTIPLAPPKPTNQIVTGVTATEVDISWQDNAGHLADGYHILRSTNHGSFIVAATLPPTSRSAPSTYSWSDTNLAPNTYYEYHIVAYNVSGNNDFAGVNATTLLPAPVLVLSQLTNNTATLYYTVPSGATSINIYRGTASGAETLLASGTTSGLYVDNTVTTGTTYYYYVTAVNANSLPIANEESAFSNQISPAISAGTFQWTGGGANPNWTTPGNWSGGVAPTGDGNESLVFPSGAARLTNIDDLPVGANAFAGISTSASGYNITLNNPLALGSGGLALTSAGTEIWTAASGAGIFLFSAESFTTASGATLTINANITEMNGRLTIAGSGNTTLVGSLAGTSGLTAIETGTLTLNGVSSYTGSTQITAGTVYAYTNSPLGMNSDVTVATGATLNVVGTFMAGAGLQGQYYNITPNSSNFASLSALNSSLAGQTPALTALSSTTSLNNSFDFGATGSAFPAPYNANATNFEAVFTGLFNAPTTGTYTFDTGSDDGSMIFIDGNVVVNNNFVQPVTVRSGTVSLSAGAHNIVIAFYQAGGGYALYADVQVPGGTLQRLPNALLSGVATSNLQIGSLAGGGTVTLGGNSLTVGGSNSNSSFTGTLTGSSGITKVGTGLQTFAYPNYSGPTTISAGTLQLGDGTHTFSVPTGTIVDNGTLAIAIPSGATLTYSNAITGSGGLTLIGGILNLSGDNSYTGATLISSGTVNANNDSALGSNSDVTVAASATLNITARGSGGLAGTYYNSAPNNAPTYLFANTATVATYVAGLPVIATDRSSNANSQNNSGAVFDYGASGQGFPSAVLANPNQFVAVWTGQFLAPSSGVYTFDTGSDDGSMLFIDGNAVVFNNAYQPLTVQSGSVPLTQGSHAIFIAYYQGGGQYGMYADGQIPGGTLQRLPNALLNTFANLQIGSLGGAGNVFVGGSNTLTVGGDNNDSTFSGVLSGSGTLVKNGTGTMTVSGANTYTGPTIINQGRVVAAANGALGTTAGGTTVGSGAALAFSSNVTYTTAEPVNIAGIGPAGNGAIENVNGTNSFAGPITLTASASIGSDAGLLTLGGTISGTGPLTFTGAGNTTVNGMISESPPLNIIKAGTGVVTLAASDSAPTTKVNAGTLKCAAIVGNGTTTVSSGASLIADHIVQGSLVIGGTAGSPATVTISASDASGNPLNIVAARDIRAAVEASTGAALPAPSITASASGSAIAATSTFAATSSEPPNSIAAALVNNESQHFSLLTIPGVVLTSDGAAFLERQVPNVANGNGKRLDLDTVAAGFADADVLEWAASDAATRPSTDADISLLSDDLLDAIGRQMQN
jgi:autotransporter-associated beta strand protein